ncbi:MAG: DUF1566 domain-containing protein [Dysgonamonadaceae bacterium]|nr:DUF1566 domain-containing protein [Dysgonamonadaceae bacterium]
MKRLAYLKIANFILHYPGDTSLLDAFTRDIQGIVTSSKTKLQWQDNYETGEINASHLNWKEAIHYCETLELNGTKWRLPNINELSTITNPQSTLDSTFTSNSEDQTYWSSTTYKGINGGVWPEGNGEENTLAWVLHVKSNSEYYTNGKDKMEELAVRCVRDE